RGRQQAPEGRPDREARARAGPGRPRPVRQRHQRRGAGRAARVRGDRLRAVPLRGLLAARRGAHGVGDAAGRQPRRRAARGGRRRRDPGRARRRRGAGRDAAPPARLRRRARPGRSRRTGPRPGAVRLAGGGEGHGRALPRRHRPAEVPEARREQGQGLRDVPLGVSLYERSTTLLPVDFERFRVKPGDRVLDMGCGAGRHAFELYRRGAHVVAFDRDAEELSGVEKMFGAMRVDGEAPEDATAETVQGDALDMPFPDDHFDSIIAAEVLQHIPDGVLAMRELMRVLRPGGRLAVTVPSWLPERVCWALSEDYHTAPGGHVRIYTRAELEAKLKS